MKENVVSVEGIKEEPGGLVVAKKLVEWGAKVVPAFCSRDGEKVPLAGNWVVNATKDVDQLERWWAERPWCWPGIVGGVGSFILFDVDGSEGIEWFRAFCAREGWPGGSCTYSTPGRSGGLHSVFRWPKWGLGTDFRQAKVCGEGWEVQLRGNGHFTLFCGARRPDCPGRNYELIEEPGEGGPIELPEKFGRAFLRESVVSVGPAGSFGIGELVEISEEDAWSGAPYADGRKNVVAGLAWYNAIRGASVASVVALCERFGAECCVPALSAETCRKKAEYAVERAERYRMKAAAEAERVVGHLRWDK